MSFLSMMEANLPPGFRFHPRDDELVCDYLAKKISHGGHGDGTVMISSSFFGGRSPMIDVDLNKCEPWDLPELACVGGKEWYLFSHRDRKYASGQRTNRATASGYWKATGKDRHITRKGLLVGMRKTLVFYQGRAPKGSKTDWVMHEFRQHHQIVPPPAPGTHAHRSKYISTKVQQQDWVLCRIFYKTRVLMISSKPPCSSMDIHEDTCSNSSSSQLPPAVPPQLSMALLPMDQNYITFGTSDHHPPAPMSFQVYQYHEQVPCFSTMIPAASSTTAAATMMAAGPAPSIQTRVVERSMPCISTKISQFTHDQFGAAGLPVPDLGMNGLQSLDCDKKVIRAVLNHLTNKNMEAGNLKREPPPPPIPASLGQGNIYLWDNNGSSFAANCQ